MAEDINNSLFSQDVLDSMESPHLFNQKHEGPVTVLGHTFDNDEERRAYFREELRKKLPELKKIEGFPIGADDDILALSDPPYFTACPNPWLNEFVEEWEKEKHQLVAEGKRTEEKVVTEPYAKDISEGKNNPVYNAHSYHTKVPHPAIMRYLLHYTSPGDIIFDGFAGTGMTGVAATMCDHPEADVKKAIEDEFNAQGEPFSWGKRHAIVSDLSPVACLISANYNAPLSSPNVYKRIESVLDQVEKEYGWLYKTKDSNGFERDINYVVWSDVFVCPNCGEKIVFYNAAVDHKTGLVSDNFRCPHCGTQHTKKSVSKSMVSRYDSVLEETITVQEKVPVLINYIAGKRSSYNKEVSEEDLLLIKKADHLAESFSYTSNRMMEGSEARRNDRQGLTHVHHFYFSRSLVILERLLSLCNDKEFRFLVNSQLVNISKLNRYRPGVSFPYNPLSGTLYIGSQISESNVFVALRNKLSKLNKIIPAIGGDNVTSVISATGLNLASDSIDYIFTDPPFGANISYSELNFLQESWLKVTTDNRDEAIVNDSHNKTLFDYQDLMTKSLSEYYRVLKPNRWMTVEFSNTSASVWNSIQNALQNVGFIVVNVAALDKQQGSFKAVNTPTAVKQDLIITCFKPSDELATKVLTSFDKPSSAMDFIEEYLQHLPVHLEREQKTTTVIERSPKILYDRLIAYYVQKGLPVPFDAAAFQDELRNRFVECDGMFFTPSQLADYKEKKKQAPEIVPMGLIVSNEADGIEWLRNRLRDNPQAYQDIQPEWMQAINGLRKGDILPELRDLLEENFIEESGGKWRLPNIQDDVDKDKLREKALLKEFKIYVEAASKPHARIKEVRVEAIRAGFKKCYMEKDFATIVMVGDKIPQNLLTEDDILLQFYDIARTRV
ncbi:MAG: hypothetical protein IJK19_00015 [Bacteroidales bacterium]|nr:hypothetical protein [Bacteroidales bacterium]